LVFPLRLVVLDDTTDLSSLAIDFEILALFRCNVCDSFLKMFVSLDAWDDIDSVGWMLFHVFEDVLPLSIGNAGIILLAKFVAPNDLVRRIGECGPGMNTRRMELSSRFGNLNSVWLLALISIFFVVERRARYPDGLRPLAE